MNVIKDLWKDKPLFITVVVGLAFLLYILYKNTSGSSIIAPATTDNTATTGAGPGPGSGTFVEYSYYNNTPVSNTYTGPASGTVSAPPPPVSTPIASSPGVSHPSTGKPAPAATHTVTVTPWPSQNSTLYGIAKSVYGDGNQWPKIYAANKSKIGNNPNLIHAGLVVTIP